MGTEKEFYKEYYKNPLILENPSGHNKIRMQFDAESRFLAVFCHHRVSVLNLASKSNVIEAKDHFDIHKTHPKKFTHMLDATLVSTSETEYRCDVAAR